MKKIFLFTLVVIFGACSNDGDAWKLTDNIGSIPIELKDSVTYSHFLPGAGTFEFKQSFERGSKPSKIKTTLKIIDNDKEQRTQFMELMVFDTINFSNATLDFIEDFSIIINDTITPYKEISANGGALIDSTNNFYIALFGKDTITGRYSGEARILQEQVADTNEATVPDKVESLFNVYGNVDTDNRLFLLTKEVDAQFSSISGTFSTEDSLFFGEAVKNKDSFSLTPQDTQAVSFMLPDTTLMIKDTTLLYNLLFTVDGIEKKLQINLTKK